MIDALAIAVREGALVDVRLDALELDLTCAPSLAALLEAPSLRVLSIARNRLGEMQLQLIAKALCVALLRSEPEHPKRTARAHERKWCTTCALCTCSLSYRLPRAARRRHGHPCLTELSVGDQSETWLPPYAIGAMLDAMETVPTLVKLRLGMVKDDVLRRRYLQLETQHVGNMRRLAHEAKVARDAQLRAEEGEEEAKSPGVLQWLGGLLRPQLEAAAAAMEDIRSKAAEAEPLSAEPAPAKPPKPMMWSTEAEGIACNAETLRFGKPKNDGKLPWRDPATHYVLTGCPEWRSATKAERLAVIRAFATNERFTTVAMNDCGALILGPHAHFTTTPGRCPPVHWRQPHWRHA